MLQNTCDIRIKTRSEIQDFDVHVLEEKTISSIRKALTSVSHNEQMKSIFIPPPIIPIDNI